MNQYSIKQQYFIWLTRSMFQQVLRDVKVLIIDNAVMDAESFRPEEYYEQESFVYQDPQGFTYKFQIAEVFMITLQ